MSNVQEQSVFAQWETKIWKYRYQVGLVIDTIHGATPDNPKIVAGWIESKFRDNDMKIQEAVAEVMVELKISAEEAMKKVIEKTSVNRFKKDDSGLYIEGRIVKAAIKEAVSVSAQGEDGIPAGQAYGHGMPKKKPASFVAEHVQVEDRRIYLGCAEADREHQKFISTFRGNAIGYEEEIDEAKVSFVVSTDFDFSKVDKEWWQKVWTTGQRQGLGGSRSQGYGNYAVTQWELID
jgi:hypothetical protein